MAEGITDVTVDEDGFATVNPKEVMTMPTTEGTPTRGERRAEMRAEIATSRAVMKKARVVVRAASAARDPDAFTAAYWAHEHAYDVERDRLRTAGIELTDFPYPCPASIEEAWQMAVERGRQMLAELAPLHPCLPREGLCDLAEYVHWARRILGCEQFNPYTNDMNPRRIDATRALAVESVVAAREAMTRDERAASRRASWAALRALDDAKYAYNLAPDRPKDSKPENELREDIRCALAGVWPPRV